MLNNTLNDLATSVRILILFPRLNSASADKQKERAARAASARLPAESLELGQLAWHGPWAHGTWHPSSWQTHSGYNVF